MTSSRGHASEIAVKSRRSQIRIAACHGGAAAAGGGAGEDLLAGVGADIGVEQGAGEAVLDADLADQREGRQQILERREFVLTKPAGTVAGKADDVPLAERVIDRPGDIVGQTLRFELLIEVVPGAVAAGLIEPLAGLGGAAVDLVERAVQILGTSSTP